MKDLDTYRWPNVTQVTKEEKVIVPKWEIIKEAMTWAEERPDSFTVYTAGIITYNTDADLTMFLVRWS